MLLESRMQRLLDEQISLEEGLLTEAHLDHYVNGICDILEEMGYEIPDELQLSDFLEAIDAVVAEGSALDEGLKDFFKRASGAVRGAVARGVAKLPKVVHRQLYKYHNKQANDAIDSGDKKAYMKHSGKAFRSLQIANPAATARQKLTAFHHAKHMAKQEPESPEAKYVAPGSKKDRSDTWKGTQRAKAQAGWYKKHGRGSDEFKHNREMDYWHSVQKTQKGIPSEQEKTRVGLPPHKEYGSVGNGTNAGTPKALRKRMAQK